MGAALLEGWLKAGSVNSAIVVEPSDLPPGLASHKSITHHHTLPASLPGNLGMAVLATKPQVMDAVCANLAGKLSATTPILSIAAGKTIAYFEGYFSDARPIIRTMPNTPAAIGAGISAACPNGAVIPAIRRDAEALLQAGGKVIWLEDENLMDAVTALSGSGPAYVFLLIELLAKAGLTLGLDEGNAAALARQTVIGSGALAAHDADTPAAKLRQNVTSPGGTTEAALKILMDGRLESLLVEALTAARDRGRELS